MQRQSKLPSNKDDQILNKSMLTLFSPIFWSILAFSSLTWFRISYTYFWSWGNLSCNSSSSMVSVLLLVSSCLNWWFWKMRKKTNATIRKLKNRLSRCRILESLFLSCGWLSLKACTKYYMLAYYIFIAGRSCKPQVSIAHSCIRNQLVLENDKVLIYHSSMF